MAKAGDIIENPVTGERVVFLQTSEETGGELLQFELFVRPGGFVSGAHIHPHQRERILVETGTIRLQVEHEERDYGVGEEATIPPGVAHAWWNAGEEELHAVVEFRPAGRFEHFITSAFALAQAGKTDKRGNPNLLQGAVVLRKYSDTLVATDLPPAVFKALFIVLDPLARMLGYKADVPYVESFDHAGSSS